MISAIRFIVATLAFLVACVGAAHADTRLVSVQTPRGVKQSFILIKPDKPVGAVILFAGGHGALGLRSAADMKWGKGNFLVRTRSTFAAHNLMVAVIDAPSDEQDGMNAIFRMSRAHADDIDAVAAHLKTREAAVPVWAVGTSMGTFSAARAAIGTKNVDGLVLTSSITRSKPGWKIASSHPNGVASMPLPEVTVPALVMSHRKDGCAFTPAADAGKLKTRLIKSKKVDVVILDGGDPPQSDPCEAKSQHGFLGIEDKAVGAIAAFIKSAP